MTPPALQPALPDELVEDILLRLDDAADLARAAASCVSFRRIVSARGFLRRFRSLHPPPILGFLDVDSSLGAASEFYQAQSPRGSAPAARAFARVADFTFSFLPNSTSYGRVRDVRDGRVLLDLTSADEFVFVVCDPLHRRYVKIPGDLMAGSRSCLDFEPFLAPAGQEAEESSLRVFCNVLSEAKVLKSFAFSSVTGMWQAVASFSIAGTYEWMRWGGYPILTSRHCAHGCFYWTEYNEKDMLVLDTLEMKFSMVDLPPESKGKEKSIVELAEGRLGLLIFGDFEFNLYSKTRRSNGAGAEEWRHDNVVPLPAGYYCSISSGGAAEGYILIRGIPRHRYCLRAKPDAQYFTLELKTLLFERLCVLKFDTSDDYLYASFPPPLSLPSI